MSGQRMARSSLKVEGWRESYAFLASGSVARGGGEEPGLAFSLPRGSLRSVSSRVSQTPKHSNAEKKQG